MPENKELTAREREILELVATGASNRQIAQHLHISSNTVKVHLRNIFAKLGVASRTEATLYAIQEGFVVGGANLVEPQARPWWQRGWVLAIGGLLLGTAAVSLGFLVRPKLTPAADVVDVEALERARWQELAPMSTARSGLTLVAYDGFIYAIAGETEQGVTGVVERYDPNENRWETLPPKPIAVDDAQGVVIGGEILMPGGRLASGEVTNVLEAFNPLSGTWKERSPLPEAMSDYTSVAYEGRLIIFGGWNGREFVEHVYEYDPIRDSWTQLSPMKGPRGDARAVVSGNQIYLLGGYDGSKVITDLSLYHPDSDRLGQDVWESLQPLPVENQGMGVSSIADVIYVFGGNETEGVMLHYFTRLNEWRTPEIIEVPPTIELGVVALGEYIYLVGGESNGEFRSNTYRYRAIYTIFLPLSSNP
jgi:DNA-binding CsgD family transcriptional regulator/N-acetylneuraminic acid mutarotase